MNNNLIKTKLQTQLIIETALLFKKNEAKKYPDAKVDFPQVPLKPDLLANFILGKKGQIYTGEKKNSFFSSKVFYLESFFSPIVLYRKFCLILVRLVWRQKQKMKKIRFTFITL